MTTDLAGELEEIERIEIDAALMAEYAKESEFLALSFDLLREVTSYTCVAACILGAEPYWIRDQAAVGGNMVRLFKVLSAVLDQTSQGRREPGEILARLAFETILNVRFLVKNFSPETVASYVSRSLRHERKLRDTIIGKIRNRGGPVWAIEERMLKSIDRAARVAGVSLDDIDLSERTPWGDANIYEKAKDLGLADAYLAAFSGPSHNVHGSWFDIYQHHVEVHPSDDTKFSPSLNWHRPRPQLLLALGHLSIDAIRDVVGFLGGEECLNLFSARLVDLDVRILQVNDAHEGYLSKKQWPEI